MGAVSGHSRNRLLAASLLLSAALHVVVVLLPVREPDVGPALLFRLPFRLPVHQFRPPDRDLVGAMERIESPQISDPPAIALPAVVLHALRTGQPLPTPTQDTLAAGLKPAEYAAVDAAPLDLNQLALIADSLKAAQSSPFARMYLPDADSTDAQSRRRRKALQIVERAIGVMGGREALSSLVTMSARVWIEAQASIHYTYSGTRIVAEWEDRFVTPYPYPVEEWHYDETGAYRKTAVSIPENLSRDGLVVEDYMLRNPVHAKSRYSRLFSNRWYFLPDKGQSRLTGEAKQWHFIERFLGEGVVIEYLGTETLRDTLTDVIRVDDRRYGHFYEAHFRRQTGLLYATVEGLTPEEQQHYRAAHALPTTPKWTTYYGNYRPVLGVLTPHRLRRDDGVLDPRHRPVCVRIVTAYNGQVLDRSPPEIEHWDPRGR